MTVDNPDNQDEKGAIVYERKASVMSYEEPISPSGSDAISVATEEEEHEHYNSDYPEKTLRPTISRASSTNAVGGIYLSALARTKSAATTVTTDPRFEIDFEENDKTNPKDWALWYRCLLLFVFSYNTTAVVLYSTSYTSSIPGLINAWGISDLAGNLGLTTYLCGMACGSVILAPLSEMYGRRPIYIVAQALFIIFVLPCALAKNIYTILVMRFFGAFCASAMIGNAPGSVNDITEEKYRALAFSVWSVGPMNGPVLGPVVGGFVYQYLGWRWTNWVVMLVAGVGWVMICLVPETYAPAILRSRAKKRRKETGDERWYSRYDDKMAFWPLLRMNLWRPFKLTITEPICMFWDLYIAVVYGILYLCFVAYPIVFQVGRGWDAGIGGLAFCGIGVGSLLVIIAEPAIRKWVNAHKNDPETGAPPPEASIAVVCVAAVLMPAGQITFAWTCTPNVHWIWPIIAGMPFGAGCAAIFIYASSYLVHSYGIYAASALAGNAVLRSLMGATLPLAGPAMYKTLGSNWAGTLLGLLEVLLMPIPFVFYKYGHIIRRKSALISAMRDDAVKLDAKRARAAATRRAVAEADAGAAMETGPAVDEMVDVEKDIERGDARRDPR